jgi:hypothetical protein
MTVTRQYTVKIVLERARAFVAHHGRAPKRADLGKNGFPCYHTLMLLFGTMDIFTALARGEQCRVKLRDCLKCSQLFVSEGAHNRVCPICKLQDGWRDPIGMRMNRQAIFGGRVIPVRPGEDGATVARIGHWDIEEELMDV